jgi:hypothetical protein
MSRIRQTNNTGKDDSAVGIYKYSHSAIVVKS